MTFFTLLFHIVFFVLISSTSFVLAAEDQFRLLENLEAGDVFTQNMKMEASMAGTKTYLGSENDMYTLTSSKFSNPHIVYVQDGKISFIQITVPGSEQSRYSAMLTTYDKFQEVYLPKVDSEIMRGFPEQGIAFITNNYSGQVERIQKFYPKSTQEFIGEEGKFFSRVPHLQPVQASTPAIEKKSFPWKLPAGLVLLVSMVILIGKFRHPESRR